MSDIKIELLDMRDRSLVYDEIIENVSIKTSLSNLFKEVLSKSFLEDVKLNNFLDEMQWDKSIDKIHFINELNFMVYDKNNNFIKYDLDKQGRLWIHMTSNESNWSIYTMNYMSDEKYIDLDENIIKFSIASGLGSAGDIVNGLIQILTSPWLSAILNLKAVFDLFKKDSNSNNIYSQIDNKNQQNTVEELIKRGLTSFEIKTFILKKEEWSNDKLKKLFDTDFYCVKNIMKNLGYKFNRKNIWIKSNSIMAKRRRNKIN